MIISARKKRVFTVEDHMYKMHSYLYIFIRQVDHQAPRINNIKNYFCFILFCVYFLKKLKPNHEIWENWRNHLLEFGAFFSFGIIIWIYISLGCRGCILYIPIIFRLIKKKNNDLKTTSTITWKIIISYDGNRKKKPGTTE